MSLKDLFDSIVSLIRAVAWPVVVLWLLLMYRGSISEVIKRLSTISGPGVSAQFGHGTSTSPTPTLDDLMSGITSERDKLLDAAQRVTKFWWFEKIWNIIYGSQIAILEHLESQPEFTARWADLYTQFYLRTVAVIPMPPFPQYMAFLRDVAQFVNWDTTVDSQNPPVTLQQLGREFLQYIRTQGYAKEMRIN